MSDVVGNPLVKFKKQLPKVEAKETLSQQQTELVIKKKKKGKRHLLSSRHYVQCFQY